MGKMVNEKKNKKREQAVNLNSINKLVCHTVVITKEWTKI